MTQEPEQIIVRLKQKLTPVELAALTGMLIFGLGMLYLHAQAPLPGLLADYQIYTQAAKGDLRGYYYLPWGMLLAYPFSLLPFYLGAFLWQVLNIGGIFFAARVFGSNRTAVLLSYPLAMCLYFGQISGVLCLGIALVWLGLAKRSWPLACFGMLLAVIKPQVGLVAVFLWLFAAPQQGLSENEHITYRRTKWLALLASLFILLLSFVFWPDWLGQTFERMRILPVNDAANLTAWKWFGLWGLLLFLPPILLPLSRNQRLIALITAWMISAPYLQPWDLSALFIFPLGWTAFLTWLAVPFSYPHTPPPLFFLLLVTGIYLWQLSPGIIKAVNRRK